MKTYLPLFLFTVLSFAGMAQNKDVSQGLVFDGEPYMVTDPTNPQHIVVAWMGYVPLAHVCIKVKTSFNGGNTWSSAAVIAHQSPTYTSADVSMAFDHSGNLYLCYIDSRQSPDSGGVFITRSTDGGLSWGSSHQVVDINADGSKKPLDRPWLVIGKKNGSIRDTLFVTTKPAPWVAAPNRPYFTKSSDYGLTWSPVRYIDSTGYRVGNIIQAPMAAPAADSAGDFHCVYPTYYPAESIYPRYIMATGGSGGAFNYNVVATGAGGGSLDTLAKAGARLICDPTNNKHFAFCALQNATGDIDIVCYETYNGGNNWSSSMRINDDAIGNGKMQDLAWANFDEHGNIIAAWRDRRNGSGTGYEQPSEIWGAIKWKDSARFSANFRISDTIVAYDSTYLAGNGNDFMNVVMANDTISAVWGDVRPGSLNIWFSRRAAITSTPTAVRNLVAEEMPVVHVYPNPSTTTCNVSGVSLQAVSIFDHSGHVMLRRVISNNYIILNISDFSAGSYQVQVTTKQGIVSQTLVKQ